MQLNVPQRAWWCRLRKEDLAATCWAVVAATQWHTQHGSKHGEELLAALSGLRAALQDDSQRGLRARALQHLHIEEEAGALHAALDLPWGTTLAPSWMSPASPPRQQQVPGPGMASAQDVLRQQQATPDTGGSSECTWELVESSHGPYHALLALHRAPPPTQQQLRSLHRCAADPARHEAWLQRALMQLNGIAASREEDDSQAATHGVSPGSSVGSPVMGSLQPTHSCEVSAENGLLQEACACSWPAEEGTQTADSWQQSSAQTAGGAKSKPITPPATTWALADVLAAALTLSSPSPEPQEPSANEAESSNKLQHGQVEESEEEEEAGDLRIPAFRG